MGNSTAMTRPSPLNLLSGTPNDTRTTDFGDVAEAGADEAGAEDGWSFSSSPAAALAPAAFLVLDFLAVAEGVIVAGETRSCLMMTAWQGRDRQENKA